MFLANQKKNMCASGDYSCFLVLVAHCSKIFINFSILLSKNFINIAKNVG